MLLVFSSKMSKVAMTEVKMPERRLLDTPHEILFEIFRRLSRGKLIGISRLCSKFRHAAGDTRLWKHVSIIYGRGHMTYPFEIFAFEDLYSEPWPVKLIDLSYTKINPPAFLQTEQMIKVEKLKLSSVTANEVTIAAILAKYQCTELYLDCGDGIFGLEPEAFSKQTALEVLSVHGSRHIAETIPVQVFLKEVEQFLPPIFKYFKNLKTLDLSHVSSGSFEMNFDIMSLVETLPTSLEKLFLKEFPEDPFFKLLAKRIPNLRELKVLSHLKVEYQSLLNFQFLEAIHFQYFWINKGFVTYQDDDNDLYKFLTKFPALKTVYIIYLVRTVVDDPPKIFGKNLRKMLHPHGIIVEMTEYPGWPLYSLEGHLWKVSESM